MADSITWTQLGSDITGDVLSDWASKSTIAVSESGNIIAIGSEKAKSVAKKTLKRIRSKLGY